MFKSTQQDDPLNTVVCHVGQRRSPGTKHEKEERKKVISIAKKRKNNHFAESSLGCIFLPHVFLDFFTFLGEKEREKKSTQASFSVCREHFSGRPLGWCLVV